MVTIETFYPKKINKTVTIESKVIEDDTKEKRMQCYGSDVEECSAVRMKREMKL
jgi:hypothetical protein